MDTYTFDSICYGLVLLLGMALGMSYLYYRRVEKREWNNGICAISGKPWRLCDFDSQGGRFYSDEDGNTLWIHIGMDDK